VKTKRQGVTGRCPHSQKTPQKLRAHIAEAMTSIDSSPCSHDLLYRGTHESFRNGWMCAECGGLILGPGLGTSYGVVFAAIRMEKLA
jgi:hypothetical protein